MKGIAIFIEFHFSNLQILKVNSFTWILAVSDFSRSLCKPNFNVHCATIFNNNNLTIGTNQDFIINKAIFFPGAHENPKRGMGGTMDNKKALFPIISPSRPTCFKDKIRFEALKFWIDSVFNLEEIERERN